MTTEKQHPTINGNDYYVKIVKTKWRKRVSVYNDDGIFNDHRRSLTGGTYITETVKLRGRFLWFGKDTTPSIEKMVQSTLNEAVCIREDKQEQQERFENKIQKAISSVEEVHE
jgi:hypothetical protein